MAPSRNRPSFACRLRSAALSYGLCGLALVGMATLTPGTPAAQEPLDGADPAPPPESSALLPWLDMSGAQSVQIRFNHEITWQAASRSISVERSDWEVRRLEFRAFGGEFNLTGQGRIRADGPDDIATTFTLRHVDLVSLMRQLNLPRTGEIEAKIDGNLAIGIHLGEWNRAQINISGQPDTVRISRRLLRELLVDYLQGAVTEEQLEATLGAYFGSESMIPLQDMTLEGNLTSQALTLKIPLRNEALNILIEPRIERNLLWEIWNYVIKNLGLDRIGGVSTSRTAPDRQP